MNDNDHRQHSYDFWIFGLTCFFAGTALSAVVFITLIATRVLGAP